MFKCVTLLDYKLAEIAGIADDITVYVKMVRRVYRVIDMRMRDGEMFEVRCESLNGGKTRFYLGTNYPVLHQIVPRERTLVDDLF